MSRKSFITAAAIAVAAMLPWQSVNAQPVEIQEYSLCAPGDDQCRQEIIRLLTVDKVPLEFRAISILEARDELGVVTVIAGPGQARDAPLDPLCKDGKIRVVVHGANGSVGAVRCGKAVATCVVTQRNRCEATGRAATGDDKTEGKCFVSGTRGAGAFATCSYVDP